MSAHTPGPWFVGETLRAPSLAVIGDRDSVVCEFPERMGAAVDADASLIAAAPELLEVLQRLMAVRSRCLIPEVDGNLNWDDDARSAIAKATGGQP